MIIAPTVDEAVGDALLLNVSAGAVFAVIVFETVLEGDPFADAVAVFFTVPVSRSLCVI